MVVPTRPGFVSRDSNIGCVLFLMVVRTVHMRKDAITLSIAGKVGERTA